MIWPIQAILYSGIINILFLVSVAVFEKIASRT